MGQRSTKQKLTHARFTILPFHQVGRSPLQPYIVRILGKDLNKQKNWRLAGWNGLRNGYTLSAPYVARLCVHHCGLCYEGRQTQLSPGLSRLLLDPTLGSFCHYECWSGDSLLGGARWKNGQLDFVAGVFLKQKKVVFSSVFTQKFTQLTFIQRVLPLMFTSALFSLLFWATSLLRENNFVPAFLTAKVYFITVNLSFRNLTSTLRTDWEDNDLMGVCSLEKASSLYTESWCQL